MLDPITAAGLGASIIQFTDFAFQLVKTGRELRTAGQITSLKNADLETVAKNLITLDLRVQRDNRLLALNREQSQAQSRMSFRTSPAELELEKVGDLCKDVATELLEALDRLKVHGNQGTWRSILHALKIVLSQGKIDSINVRLERARSAMNTWLLLTLRESIDALRSTNAPNMISKGLKMEILKAVAETSSPEGFGHRLQAASKEDHDASLNTQILGQLGFLKQRERESHISQAHSQTFQWIFKDPENRGPERWSNFVSWLRDQSQHLYWMTGKAGSGKSTLMKYILHEEQTIKNLQAWAGGHPLVLARFYFWNSGSQEQMSQEGLLRSLLHDALTARPELIAAVFPQRWERCQLLGSDARPFTVVELQQAFEKLVFNSNGNYKLCIFIDGLDEFDGDHGTLVEMLKSAVLQPNVKACLSSRLWPIFEEAFLHQPNLMLQNLTHLDIIRYTTEKFHSNSGFRVLQQRDPDYARDLITKIADKASGVFLWVTLTVKSLLAGLSNRDRISDLQRRLADIPPDLEDFYFKMFDSIEPFYKAHACQIFRVARSSKGNLTALNLSFVDEEDDQFALTAEVVPSTFEQELERAQEIKTRLNGLCKGFLEIPETDNDPHPEGAYDKESFDKDQGYTKSPDLSIHEVLLQSIYDNPSYEGITQPEIQYVTPDAYMSQDVSQNFNSEDTSTYSTLKPTGVKEVVEGLAMGRLRSIPLQFRRISYLHRTAKDFLESPSIDEQITLMSRTFDPCVSILRGTLLIIKTWRPDVSRGEDLCDNIRSCLTYASEAEVIGKPQYELLDALEHSVTTLLSRNPKFFTHVSEPSGRCLQFGIDGSEHPNKKFMDLAATYSLNSYITFKALQNEFIFADQAQLPLLNYVIARYQNYSSLCADASILKLGFAPSLTLIQKLLGMGADPNKSYNGQTAWSMVLDNCIQAGRLGTELSVRECQYHLIPLLQYWSDIVECFIGYGADPSVDMHSQCGSCIREAFSTHLPGRSRQLEKMISRKSRSWSIAKRLFYR